MNKLSLSDGEWKLMNLIWDDNPQTIGRLVEALRRDTGWTKATVNVMLNRLAEKGAVRIETGGRSKLFYPVLDREQAVVQEAKSTLEKIKTGGIGLLISTIAGESELTKEDVEKLYSILKGGIKND